MQYLKFRLLWNVTRVKKPCSPSIMERWLLKMNATRCIKTSETTRPSTRRHIPEDSNPQPQRYQNLTSCTLHWSHEITTLTTTCVKMTLNRWRNKEFWVQLVRSLTIMQNISFTISCHSWDEFQCRLFINISERYVGPRAAPMLKSGTQSSSSAGSLECVTVSFILKILGASTRKKLLLASSCPSVLSVPAGRIFMTSCTADSFTKICW